MASAVIPPAAVDDLARGCPQCGFVASSDWRCITTALRSVLAKYQAVIDAYSAGPTMLSMTGSSDDGAWSLVDYVVHVGEALQVALIDLNSSDAPMARAWLLTGGLLLSGRTTWPPP